MWSLSCAEAIQSASLVSGGIALNVGVHLVCSWVMVSSLSSQAALLDPPQNVTFFQKSSSHVLLHVLVNVGPHIQPRFHKMIMDYKQEVCMQC